VTKRTRTLIAGLVACLLPAACTTSKLHPYELDESEIADPALHRVGLLPLNALVALPPELDGAAGRVTSVIRAHLEACGVEVVPFSMSETRSAWSQVSDTGSQEGTAREGMRAYVEHLHGVRAFDVLLLPSLLYRDAEIRSMGKRARWDGVEREIRQSGHVNMDGSVYVQSGLRGKMPAVSLHLAAYRLDGTRVFNSFGGLDLVHEVEFGTVYRQQLNNRFPESVYQWRLRRKRLRDMDALREGVAMAFTPWLDAPEPSLAESATP
jgi:hypothetical protein